MFVGVVIGPLVLFVIGGLELSSTTLSSLLLPVVLIAMLLVASIGGGLLLFRKAAYIGKNLSIGPNRD
jgi:hypothetical protein